MRILVLGCGPAGLLATHAAAHFPGVEIVIASFRRKSQLHGCQYLHEPIDGIDHGRQQMVSYELHGSIDDYAQKIYGSQPLPVAVSPTLYEGLRPAWDLRAAYDQLWALYEDLIVETYLHPASITEALAYYAPDAVISSVPAELLCQQRGIHSFTSVRCWAIGDAPERGQRVPFTSAPFTVHCDGTKDVSYYRLSNVFGRTTIEWPGSLPKPPITGVVKFEKPLMSTCDCWGERIKRVGRYGRWQKGILSHHAYADAFNYVRVLTEKARS